MATKKDRMPTYEQKERELELLAGIHGAVTKNVSGDDYDTIKRIIANGGGPSMYPVGSILYTEKDNYIYPWMFVHHGVKSDGRPYAHLRVMKAVDLLQYDAAEAFYFAEEGLAAGQYNFELPTAYGATPAGNYQFVLASDLPAGGRLLLPNLYSASPVGKNVTAYNAANEKTVAQTAVVSSGSGGPALGLLQINGDPDNENMNGIQRVCYGSNNWSQSAARQYLNSSAIAGSVWSSSNKFDQFPSWHATAAGFLSKLPQGFIDIVSMVTNSTVTNTIFEVNYTKSSSYTTRDLFWLPSRYQVFGTTEGSDLNETQWQYYVGATDADRIMYDGAGTARFQWLRSPDPGSAYSVRGVYPSGALSSSYAGNTVAVAPACEISA